ncbi:hypothetical protein DSUL_20304 [Desulfovibrionales bacterium]
MTDPYDETSREEQTAGRNIMEETGANANFSTTVTVGYDKRIFYSQYH